MEWGTECSVKQFIEDVEMNKENHSIYISGNYPTDSFFNMVINADYYEVDEYGFDARQNKFELVFRWEDVKIRINEEDEKVYYFFFNRNNIKEDNSSWDIAIEFI